MVSTFTLILAIVTFLTGIAWIFKKYYIQLLTTNNRLELKIPLYIYKWLETTASVFPMLLLVLIIRSFIYEPFQVSSGSMMPTLLAGDFIMVKKFSYNIKNPFTKNTWINISKPKRGEVVVFHYPLNPKINYIKRIIGIPGDKISYDYMKKEINIQPMCHELYNCKKLEITYSKIKPSNYIQTFKIKEGSIESYFYQIKDSDLKKNGIRLFERYELLSNLPHRIFLLPRDNLINNVNLYYKQPNQPLATWLVPKGYYFMMGDNRDNSADSRYWGFVPEKNLVGKAVFIWMSFSLKPDTQRPNGIRFNRIGTM
ncbi:MAG: signal peptidase I [Candidatus Dasytiphilus stammeri]